MAERERLKRRERKQRDRERESGTCIDVYAPVLPVHQWVEVEVGDGRVVLPLHILGLELEADPRPQEEGGLEGVDEV